jgi:hypothetical protein
MVPGLTTMRSGNVFSIPLDDAFMFIVSGMTLQMVMAVYTLMVQE